MSYRILVVNPGSTSTKIGVYEDENLLLTRLCATAPRNSKSLTPFPPRRTGGASW